MELTVQVTAADIEHGIAQDCEECPLAIAVYRALSTAHPELAELVPFTDGSSVLLYENVNPLYRAEVPEYVTQFIRNFDCDEQVSPFTVSLSFAAIP